MNNYYLVLGATNSVIDHVAFYPDESLAIKHLMQFIGDNSVPVPIRTVVSSTLDGVNRRALYLAIQVDEVKANGMIYVLVRSVPYLHSTTRARVFYDEQQAKTEYRSFNAAVSRTYFHAYLFKFLIPSF